MLRKKIEKENWQRYFDNLTKKEKESSIHIQENPKTKSAVQSRGAAKLLQMTYDSNDEELYIFTEDETLAIPHPTEIYAQHNGNHVLTLEILNHLECKQLIISN